MQRGASSQLEQECFEYHGSTTVERIQVYKGAGSSRDWLLFDTVEEAQDFYNETLAAVSGSPGRASCW